MELTERNLRATKILVKDKKIQELVLQKLMSILGKHRFVGKGAGFKDSVYLYVSSMGNIYYGVSMAKYLQNNYKEIFPSDLGINNSLKHILGEHNV